MTADPRSADIAAREQIRTRLDQTLFVEASAGTGKTAALVDRYLALVLDGKQVDRIVAITFTEKAAAELRDRIRGELDERLATEPDAERQRRIQAALATLDRAQISTIHAFCQAVLRSFAARAGVDPAFQVHDEVAAERRFEERWRTYLERLGRDPDAIAALSRVLDLGMTPLHLEELAHDLWRHGDLAEELERNPLTAPAAEWPNLDEMLAGLRAIPIDRVKEGDRLVPRIEDAIGIVESLIAAADREGLLVVTKVEFRLGRTGAAPNWRGIMDIDDARQTVMHAAGRLQATLAALRSAALADAMPYVVRFVIEEATERGREGLLTFDDLILKVRDVLGDTPEARRRLRDQYDVMLIDEFQDTDPLQADIARYFAEDPASGEPEPGRLFLVGDPKQSIYRFRRADMVMYVETRERLVAGGAETVDLSLNRRSQPGVIEWVNAVFERVIGPGLMLTRQPAYQKLERDRADSLEGVAVACFGEAVEEPAAATRQHEARLTVAHIRDAVRRGWQVYDRRDEVVRPARYGDIAVLLPARTILPQLERAFAAGGIPYRVEGGSLVYATQEIRDLINCLTAIDDPTDDVAVVAALRSPGYACSDPEIASYRLAENGSFNYRWLALDEHTGRVADGLKDLRQWHERRASLSIAALIEAFTKASRLVEIGLRHSGNRNAFRRARFLVQQARDFEAAGPETLRAFVEWLERRAGDAIYDHEGAALDDDEDAVRILTIHAAKGLEFPIVFLAGLGIAPSPRIPRFTQDRGNGQIAVRAGRANTQFDLGDVELARKSFNEHEAEERKRLLYVAATRARDHLVVSLFRRANARNSAQDLVEAGAEAQSETLPPTSISDGAPQDAFANVAVDEVNEAGFEAKRQSDIRTARKRSFTSATGLAAGRGFEPEKEEREDETEPWSRGRGATHLGRAVHAALQSLPWDADDAAIAAVARAQSVAEAIPEREDDAERLIKRAMRSGAAQRARAAKRALREVPFAFLDESVSPPALVEGFADLVIETDDGIEIVDWKTDSVSEAEIDERLQGYHTQAGLYVLGLERALAPTGRKVTAVTYVFVTPNQERSPGVPSELASFALERLAETSVSP